MIKNIILFFLAICFILLIISYLLNINQMKLWDSSIIEGATITKIPQKVIEEIEATLALRDGDSSVTYVNIVTNLYDLQVYDPGFQTILKKEISDDQKIKELKVYTKDFLKPSLSADGLILHYKLDEITGSGVKNIAADTMDNPEYNGIITGAKIDTSDYVYGKGCVQFKYDSSKINNATDYIKIPSIPNTFYDGDVFQGFTFATWYKNTANSKPWSRLFDFASDADSSISHTIYASVNWENSTNYTFVIWGPPDKDNKYEFNATTTIQPLEINKWIHVATTISKNGTYINYINGKETPSNYKKTFENTGTKINSNILAGIDDPDTKSLRVPSDISRKFNYIGKNSSGSGGFDGRMNDFRIYRRALTADEIMNIYKLKNPEPAFKPNAKIQLDAKPGSVYINNKESFTDNSDTKKSGFKESFDGTYFKDQSKNNNSGYPGGVGIEYCPRTGIVTIPSGAHLEINQSIANSEFTIAIVINVKTFTPTTHYSVNYLIGTSCPNSGRGGFELYITNNKLICGTTCVGPVVQYDFTNSRFRGDAVNIYVVKMDSNNNVSISINGIPCITSKNLPHNWGNSNIHIGRGPKTTWWEPNGKWYSSDSMDFYEFMYITEFYSADKQQELEAYLAKKWGLTDSLPRDNPYLTI